LRKAILLLLAALPLAAMLYEGGALLYARAKTPEILGRVSSRETRLSTVPARWLRMLLAVEDPGFFRHRGIDFDTPGQGMTTMTQSLAKFLYFGRFTPGIDKPELMLVARFALDPAAGKREQLEIFVNYASFGTRRGRPVIGFAAAAPTFFGRELSQLSDREYLSLVAMLVSPNSLDPLRHREANAERTDRIIAYLSGRCGPRGLRDIYYADCAGAARRHATPVAGVSETSNRSDRAR